jgi:hypothetical protein
VQGVIDSANSSANSAQMAVQDMYPVQQEMQKRLLHGIQSCECFLNMSWKYDEVNKTIFVESQLF